jgi:hypothetical protein
MTGYAIALWTSTMCSNMTMAVYALPRRLPQWMMYYPTFPFVRAMYILIDPCTWEKCYGDYTSAPEEFREMELRLLGHAFIYFWLALYLNEVLPQTYGVPKHPLYLFEDFFRKYLP